MQLKSTEEMVIADLKHFYDTYALSAIAHQEFPGNNPYHSCCCVTQIGYHISAFTITSSHHWGPRGEELANPWKRYLEHIGKTAWDNSKDMRTIYDKGHWDEGCGHNYGNYLRDAHPHYAYGLYQLYLKTGDNEFLQRVYPMAVQAMEAYWHLDKDNDGLVEVDGTGCAEDGSISNWWDAVCYGHKDAYTNAWFYAGLKAIAELSQIVDPSAVARYRKAMDKLHQVYNKQFWNEKKGRYVGWVDSKGKVHDAFYTSPNLIAIWAGLADEKKAKTILYGIDSSPNAYRIFGLSSNLEPMPVEDQSTPQPFGFYMNGGVFVVVCAFDIYARAKFQSGINAYEKFVAVMDQYRQDRLYGYPVIDYRRPYIHNTGKQSYRWDRGKSEGSGNEPYLADGMAVAWAFYAGILGIELDIDGIKLDPHIPLNLKNTIVTVALRGKKVTFHYRGSGDRLDSLSVNGEDIEGNLIRWELLKDETLVDVKVK